LTTDDRGFDDGGLELQKKKMKMKRIGYKSTVCTMAKFSVKAILPISQSFSFYQFAGMSPSE